MTTTTITRCHSVTITSGNYKTVLNDLVRSGQIKKPKAIKQLDQIFEHASPEAWEYYFGNFKATHVDTFPQRLRKTVLKTVDFVTRRPLEALIPVTVFAISTYTGRYEMAGTYAVGAAAWLLWGRYGS